MPKIVFIFAFFVAMYAQQADSLGKRSELAQTREQHVFQDGSTDATFKTPMGQSIALRKWISGKWYHTISCPAWSGRYIYHIRQFPDGALQGFSFGISFGAKGHSSEIISGKALGGSLSFWSVRTQASLRSTMGWSKKTAQHCQVPISTQDQGHHATSS